MRSAVSGVLWSLAPRITLLLRSTAKATEVCGETVLLITYRLLTLVVRQEKSIMHHTPSRSTKITQAFGRYYNLPWALKYTQRTRTPL
jgi:hypothetical protein